MSPIPNVEPASVAAAGHPEPVVFFAAGRPLAGLFHAPSGPPRGMGLVLCNPFGYEAICAYRGYRGLAEALAAAGFAVLRFDNDGTGDSIGDDLEPGRVEAWKASISAALDYVKARSGASALGLFGMRLGALLGSVVAAERGDVSLLAIWAPIPSGRAAVREIRAFDLLKQQKHAGAPLKPQTFGDEAAGFVLTPGTVEELGKLDLAKLQRAPAPKILLVPRDDLPAGEDRLAGALRKQGCDLTVESVPGYSGFLIDPLESPKPVALIAAARAWFESQRPLTPFAAPSPLPCLAVAGDGFLEESFWFGPGERLFGILTRPPGRPSQALGAIFLNVGSVHHVGSNRMFVRMARRLAASGMTSLRFDLSGLGESKPAPGEPENLVYRFDSTDDLRTAMTALSDRSKVRRFAVVGLCSGTYTSYFTAQVDPRIAAQVLINSRPYRWYRDDDKKQQGLGGFGPTRAYLRAALKGASWRRLVAGEIRAAAIARTLTVRAWGRLRWRALALLGKHATEITANLTDASNSGISTYFLFSRDDDGLEALEEHLGPAAHALRGRPNVRHEVIDHVDHTFTSMWSQIELEKRVTGFLNELCVAAGPEPRPK